MYNYQQILYTYLLLNIRGNMIKYSAKTRQKLYEYGEIIGLDGNDINKARRMTKDLFYMFLIIGIFTFIGLFSSRLVTVGAWYAGASIKDFFILDKLARFF